MQFGRVFRPENYSFDLMEDSTFTQQVLATRPSSDTQLFHGCPIWAQKEWVGTVYPKGTKPADYLQEYAKQFPAIELNSTFYHAPDLQTIRRWKEVVPKHFRFCPKIPRSISHEASSQQSASLLSEFLDRMQLLEENLGCFFLQLSDAVTIKNVYWLEQILKLFPSELQLFVEFRHPHWFDRRQLRAPVAELLLHHGVGTVITDVAGRRDVSHSTLTQPRAFIRYSGNNLHANESSRLAKWAKKITSWNEQGIHEVYFFIHQPDDAFAPQASNLFVEQMNQEEGFTLSAWNNHKERSGQDAPQLELF